MPTVLVADDSPTIVEMLTCIFQEGGYQVLSAADGVEAAEKVFAHHPDLLVLDVQIPRMNGYQVCRLLKDDEETRRIPIIMFTSQDQRSDMYWGLRTGADEYLSKGVEPQLLVKTAEALLRRFAPNVARAACSKEAPGPGDVLYRANELTERKFCESAIANEIGRVAHYIHDFEETVNSVMGVILDLLDHRSAAVGIVDGDALEIVIRSGHRLAKAYVRVMEERVRESLGLVRGVEFNPREVRVSLYSPVKGDSSKGELVEWSNPFVSVPLQLREEALGVFALNTRTPTGISSSEERILKAVCTQIAIVIDNARLYRKVRQMSITDGLTGLANRQYFHDQLEREVARARRYSFSFSLIMADIDHFKVLNDTYGHQEGDLVLKELAGVLKSQVRAGDVVARYGGEEFAIILPQIGTLEARHTAERLRQAVEQFAFSGLPRPLSVAVSVGVASFPSRLAATPEELIRRADASLYRAKRGGRNQVQVAEGNGCEKADGCLPRSDKEIERTQAGLRTPGSPP